MFHTSNRFALLGQSLSAICSLVAPFPTVATLALKLLRGRRSLASSLGLAALLVLAFDLALLALLALALAVPTFLAFAITTKSSDVHGRCTTR